MKENNIYIYIYIACINLIIPKNMKNILKVVHFIKENKISK